jgi:hypothetical protein
VLSRLILIIALVAAVYYGLRWFLNTPPHKVAKVLRKGLLYGGIGLLVLLVLTGRLHWLFAALGALVPLVQRGLALARVVPLVRQVLGMARGGGIGGGLGGGAGGNTGRTSEITTRFLRMTLDHDSGDMDGVVLEGPLEGRDLSALDLDELRELYGMCRAADAQSAAVLEAYLDRHHGDAWRQGEQEGQRTRDTGAAADAGPMTREEAAAVLGVPADADADTVRAAHRRLMQKLHPDRGGSDYLAAKVNRAKDLLIAG